ncbi:hypothetical protein PACILC2_56800 [Paenibacillus cisolokensis]|uniref:Extracellular solute-binding protein n=1 Tax=Paenibacillus cisolokensis TaxID=1658519 RepID=A0ABQ4NFT9_9BACL|nr:extracellular solute-binding protein [Paenibacillus cisolokensis]GIQ67112.1 hypothetical protein PACILC2_56800 [Paenibacillus cisolokensis]
MKPVRSRGLYWLVLAVLLILSACSSGGGNSGDESGGTSTGGGEDGGKSRTLSIMWWGTDARHEATKQALELYTQQNPGVSFKPEYMAWDAYWQKLPTLAASKSIADVLQMDAAYLQEYVARGQLEDLSDIDLSDVVDAAVIENLKIDGKLYVIPLSLNAQGIAYNKTELEAAGIPLPHKDWTWEEFSNGRGMPGRSCRKANIRSATRRPGTATSIIRRPREKVRLWRTEARRSTWTRRRS